MVSGEDQSTGRASLIGWLAVPRRITLVLLLITGGLLAKGVWVFLGDPKIISWLSSITAPFCMMCATIVWAMRDKLEAFVDAQMLTASEYAVGMVVERKLRDRSGWLASTVALAGLVASFPALASQFLDVIYQWMVLLAGIAAAYSLYAYLVAAYWDDQLRALRHRQVLQHKRRGEQETFLGRIQPAKEAKQAPTPSWADSIDLE